MDIDKFLIEKGLKTDCIVESDIDVDKYVQHQVKDLIKEALTKQLILHGVMPMLPKMTSNEFQNYLKSSGYERIDDELLQKGNDYYCVNNVYRHFLNLIEFVN